MNITESAIQEESEKISKSAKSLLEALLLSEIVSLQFLAKECGARGIVGVRDLLQRFANKMQVNKINYVLSWFSAHKLYKFYNKPICNRMLMIKK